MSPKRQRLGSFEGYVVAAVHRLADEAYGTLIIEDVEQLAGREISFGAVYTVLGRLEAKGLVESALGEATAQRGGRAKRYFRLTTAGESALRDYLSELRSNATKLAVLEVHS